MLAASVLNFSLVVTMGIILIAIFIIILSKFKSLLIEFEYTFYYLEMLLFSIIPLLSSVIITWFLCVEIPSLDMSICFSTIYFVYIYTLATPRYSSHPSALIPTVSPIYTISLKVIKAMYDLPVVLSLVLHIAFHHNVLLDSWDRFLHVMISFLLPILYTIVAMESQMKYWPHKEITEMVQALGRYKLIVSFFLFYCLQDHPILDDLKTFSGFSNMTSSFLMLISAIQGSLAVYIHRVNTIKPSKHEYIYQKDYKKDKIADMRVSLCLAGCALSMGTLLGMPGQFTVCLYMCFYVF